MAGVGEYLSDRLLQGLTDELMPNLGVYPLKIEAHIVKELLTD